jgi:hypothetical protein
MLTGMFELTDDIAQVSGKYLVPFNNRPHGFVATCSGMSVGISIRDAPIRKPLLILRVSSVRHFHFVGSRAFSSFFLLHPHFAAVTIQHD